LLHLARQPGTAPWNIIYIYRKKERKKERKIDAWMDGWMDR